MTTVNTQNWTQGKVLGFDTETTGVNIHKDRIVTAALVLYDLQTGTTTEVKTWLLDPQIEIPKQASDVHGITTEYARQHGQDFKTGLAQISNCLCECLKNNIPIVAYNASYDISILEYNLKAMQLPTLSQLLHTDRYPVIDPLVLDRSLDRYRKGKRTLAHIMDTYGVVERQGLHNAQTDVEVTLEVLGKMVKKFPELADYDLDGIYDFQRKAHADWAQNFNQWLRSKGRVSDVSTKWPLQ